MIYALDANVFIQAARQYYAFDVAPGFWDGLTQNVLNSKICSIDRVNNELMNEDIRSWIDQKNGFPSGFASTNSTEIATCYAEIIAWVSQQGQFLDSAKAEFASGADGWLIAYARIKGLTVVTQEVLNPEIKRRVPIPNVCRQFGVPYLDTFAMNRTLGIRLRL
jgi:hypothetical protein